MRGTTSMEGTDTERGRIGKTDTETIDMPEMAEMSERRNRLKRTVKLKNRLEQLLSRET